MKILVVLLLIASQSLHAQTIAPYRIGIVVSNAERSTAWYEEYLEFKCYKRMDLPQYDSLKINFLKRDGFEIELVQKATSFSVRDIVKEYDIDKAPLEGFVKLAFRVENIHETYRSIHHPRVKEIMGVTFDDAMSCDFFLIEDPDGNMLQFISPRK
jgi:catechol 2,3-dioxygenase-like lactoylglutathione lyase family enzyme